MVRRPISTQTEAPPSPPTTTSVGELDHAPPGPGHKAKPGLGPNRCRKKALRIRRQRTSEPELPPQPLSQCPKGGLDACTRQGQNLTNIRVLLSYHYITDEAVGNR